MREGQGLATSCDLAALRTLRLPGFGDRGDGFSGYTQAADAVVPRHVVCNQSEEWGQCPRLETRTGTEQLSNSLGMATQVTAGYGAAWPRWVERLGGSG